MTTTPNGARSRICEAAIELMARKGVAGTTTQEIARRARCSQAAIYKYWESKESLAQERFEEAHRGLIEAMEGGASPFRTASERVVGTLVGLLRYARRHPAEYAFLFQVFHSDLALWLAPHRKPRDLVLRELREAVRRGEVPAGNPELKGAMLLGMAVRLAFFERQKLVDGGAEEIEEGLMQAAAAVLEN